MLTFTYILLACAAGALILYGLGVWSTLKHLRQPVAPAPEEGLPPVSLLKPIKGTEEALEANLRTFFEQDYPASIEIVFASTEPDDPGIALARRVAQDYPHVPVRFVRSDLGFGLNPKVANLAGALRGATHDLVLQSDANVRVRPDYLRRVVREMLAVEGSLLTSLVVGVGEESPGAAMENLQLSAFIGPAMCTALHVGGVNCVVGKSMLLRRSELEALGGLEQVRDILAEDFVLGQRYQQAGRRVLLSCTPVENVNQRIGVKRFLARHSRWLKMRAVIHLGAFVGDLFANPVALAATALVASGFQPWVAAALCGILAVKVPGDAFLMLRTRGVPMKARHLFFSPIKDVLMGFVWVYSVFSRSVQWRGIRLRFGSGSRLRPDDGALPVRLARRLVAPFRTG
ncbi:MAG: glycosyltransferase [Myxococcota bacterium]